MRQKPIIPSVHNFSAETIKDLLVVILKSGESSAVHFDGISDLIDFIDIMRSFRATADIHLLSDTPLEDLNSIIEMKLTFPLRVCMHIETQSDIKHFSSLSRKNGISPGLAFKLKTDISLSSCLIEKFDYIHLICNDDGSGIFGFDDYVYEKIRTIHELGREKHTITLDSGVKEDQIKPALGKGVANLVMGSAIFDTKNPLETLKRFNSIAKSCNPNLFENDHEI